MAAQSLLAKLGMRLATLGSAASLAIAAPITEGNPSMAAHTDATRIGTFYDRTPGAEKHSTVVMGITTFQVGTDHVIIAQGAAPATPVDGMVWITSAGMFCRAGGATSGPFAAGGGTIAGSIAAGEVAVGSGANTIAGSAVLTWTTTNGLSNNRSGASASESFGLTLNGKVK